MAISVPSAKPKKDTLDIIAQSLGIAGNILGVGLAIPKFLESKAARKADDKRADKAEDRTQLAQDLSIARYTRLAEDVEDVKIKDEGTPSEIAGFQGMVEEPGAFDIGGERRVLRGDVGKKLTQAEKFDNKILRLRDKGIVKIFNRSENKFENLPETEGLTLVQTQPSEFEHIEDSGDLLGIGKEAGLLGQIISRDIAGEKEVTGRKLKFADKVDKAAEKFNAREDALAGARRQFDGGAAIQENLALNIIARAVGGEKGVMTDRDFKRVSPGALQRDIDVARNYLKGVNIGTMTPEQRRIVDDVLEKADFQIALSRSINVGRKVSSLSKVFGELTSRQVEGYKEDYGDWEIARELTKIEKDFRKLEDGSEEAEKLEAKYDILKERFWR